jgi:hypothetical protein
MNFINVEVTVRNLNGFLQKAIENIVLECVFICVYVCEHMWVYVIFFLFLFFFFFEIGSHCVAQTALNL